MNVRFEARGHVAVITIHRNTIAAANGIESAVTQPDAIFASHDIEAWCAEQLAGCRKPRRAIRIHRLRSGSTGKVRRCEVSTLLGDG